MFSGKQALACADQTCISLEHVIFRFVSKLVMTLAHFRGHSALLHQMVNMCRGKTEDVRVFVRDILIFMMGKAFNVIIPVTDDLKTAILRISDISIYFMMKSLRITFRFRVKKRMKPDKRGRKSPYTFKEKSSLCIYPAWDPSWRHMVRIHGVGWK